MRNVDVSYYLDSNDNLVRCILVNFSKILNAWLWYLGRLCGGLPNFFFTEIKKFKNLFIIVYKRTVFTIDPEDWSQFSLANEIKYGGPQEEGGEVVTNTAVGLAKHSQQIAKLIAYENHLHKYDVTKHKVNKQTNTYINK